MENLDISFGGIESPPDYRNVPLGAVVDLDVPIPDSYFADVTKLPIWNQKANGSCVGHASAKKKQQSDYIEANQVFPLSPRFVYAMAKKEDGLPVGQQGTYYQLGVKIIQKYGCMTENYVPNRSDLSHDKYIDIGNLPQEAWDEAKKYAIKSYAQVNVFNEQELDRAIIEGQGILLGVKLDSAWWSGISGLRSFLAKDILPLRPPQHIISGHAIYLYGFDKPFGRKRYWFLNSWGQEWGEGGKGYFYFDEYSKYFTEGWTVVDLPNNWLDELRRLPAKPKHYFSFDLRYGSMKNSEVMALQDCLKYEKFMPAWISSTGNYLEETRKAVLAFQMKYKVASLTELLFLRGKRVGVKTRTKLNQLFI